MRFVLQPIGAMKSSCTPSESSVQEIWERAERVEPPLSKLHDILLHLRHHHIIIFLEPLIEAFNWSL